MISLIVGSVFRRPALAALVLFALGGNAIAGPCEKLFSLLKEKQTRCLEERSRVISEAEQTCNAKHTAQAAIQACVNQTVDRFYRTYKP